LFVISNFIEIGKRENSKLTTISTSFSTIEANIAITNMIELILIPGAIDTYDNTFKL